MERLVMVNGTEALTQAHLRKSKSSLSFIDFIYIFCIGGLLGTVYEVVLTLCTKGVWEDRSGSILTPCNYVYGIGAVIIALILYQNKNNLSLFIQGIFLGGAIEFILSFLQEAFLGCRSWDYSDRLMNIGGRTTIPYMLVWGILCFWVVRIVFPFVLTKIRSIPLNVRQIGRASCRERGYVLG